MKQKTPGLLEQAERKGDYRMSFLSSLRLRPQPMIPIDIAKTLIDLAFQVGEYGAEAKAFGRACAAMNTAREGGR